MSYGIERFFLLSYCLACCWPGFEAKSNLRVVRQWAEVNFAFPSEQAKQTALQKNFYIPGRSALIDVEVHHQQNGKQSRIFVTNPRFEEGHPITLGIVGEDSLIYPYPDYSWHDEQGVNCNGMTSVFRVAIDECNRLWVMDSGKVGDVQSCEPQLLAFDLSTDRLIFRHTVNLTADPALSLYVTPVVDVRGQGPRDCLDTFVYVADVSGFSILVVDVGRNRSWRVRHRLFYPYPPKGTFTVDGESFDLMDGVLGMALTPWRPGQDRVLYFHALSSTTENAILTSVLRNTSYIEDSNLDRHAITLFPNERSTQSAAEAIDRDGIMFFGLMEPPSIWCWNTATEFGQRNFHQVALDRETLQFASGIKVVNNLKGEQELWILTSSFQRIMTGSVNDKRVNYRIHAEKIRNLLANSPCKNPPKYQSPGYHTNLVGQRG